MSLFSCVCLFPVTFKANFIKFIMKAIISNVTYNYVFNIYAIYLFGHDIFNTLVSCLMIEGKVVPVLRQLSIMP